MAEDSDWMATATGAEAAGGGRPPSAELHPEIAHPARIYNALIGGKDNFAADRLVAAQLTAAVPEAAAGALANRAFLGRAVRTAAALGVRQFLDIGTGIPTAGNTHEVAQSVDPSARIAYVDNDPIVLAHARALMSGCGHGATSVTRADLRDTEAVLAAPGVRDLLDFSEPVALMLVAILHFVSDDEDPFGIVKRLLAALPTGSLLVLSHGSGDLVTPEQAELAERSYDPAAAGIHLRTRDDIARFFDGLTLLEPGLVTAPRWRPDTAPGPDADRLGIYTGVARL
ncbi:SAM-dependent methyltransferase [Streptacidiphilus carbonis]|uniref:SAM-dependent methyltransferase n=1 Tax=Streptacidiphilus carbonis TaxID=105422 RepID=UPI000B2C69F7|nr:SAM-dependent methyltransferase [Streptacidiphilus carbonis]